MMNEPNLSLLMQVNVDVGELVPIGRMAQGERRVVALQGGTFDSGGAGCWHGIVLPGGADWQLLRNDGVLEVDARYVLQDSEGNRVQVISQGLRHGPDEVMAALTRGEAVDPARYYFRTAMRFETDAAPLAHLNRMIAVGVGERLARCVRLRVFGVG